MHGFKTSKVSKFHNNASVISGGGNLLERLTLVTQVTDISPSCFTSLCNIHGNLREISDGKVP